MVLLLLFKDILTTYDEKCRVCFNVAANWAASQKSGENYCYPNLANSAFVVMFSEAVLQTKCSMKF